MYQTECAKEKTKNIKFLACKIRQSHWERCPDLMTRKARYSVDNLLPLNSSPESKVMRSEVFTAESVLGIWSSETHIHMEEQKKGKRKVTFGSVEQEFGMFPSRHRVLQWTDNRQRNKQTNKQNTYVSVELAEKPWDLTLAQKRELRDSLKQGRGNSVPRHASVL